jgi:hypothetical protein
MLTLSKTENCSYIEIKSETLSDFISNSNNYTNFVVSGTLNCCTSETNTVTITEDDILNTEWKLQFPTDSSLVITGLYFQNIYTNQQWNIFSTQYDLVDYMCSTGDITDLFVIIQNWFTANLGVTITQSYTYDAGTNTCTYEISDLPDGIAPVYLSLENSIAIPSQVYFQYFPVNSLLFTGTSMLVSPSFFSLLNYVDGVYSFTLTYTTESGDIITETNCFFLDCVTACNVSTKLQSLMTQDKTATNFFLLHYTLTEGSNCGCNCTELCEIFTKLCNELNSSDTCNCGC